MIYDENRRNSYGSAHAQAMPQTKEFHEGLRQHMLSVYNTMGIGLGITGLVGYVVSTIPQLAQLFLSPAASWVMLAGLLGFMFIGFSPRRVQNASVNGLRATFYAFSAFYGAFASVYFTIYTSESLARVFFVTAGMFLAMSLYGYTTKKDLTGWRSFLIMGVFGLIIAMLVNLFLQSAMIHFAVSAIGIVIYAGLTAYDTQNQKHIYMSGMNEQDTAKMGVMGAMSLYWNFILLFQFILSFMGSQR